MPKINLLQQSAAEPGGSKASPVSTQTSQLIVAGIVILVLTVTAIFVDWRIANGEKETVKKELEKEQKKKSL